mgnify:CR=1 FL=1
MDKRREVGAVNQQEFAGRTEAVKARLYRTAYLYLGNEDDALEAVDEADLVLLEGGKNWDFPKIELVRKGNSERLAGNGRNLLAVATDMESFQVKKEASGTCEAVSEDGSEVPVIALDDYKKAANLILELLAGGQEAQP